MANASRWGTVYQRVESLQTRTEREIGPVLRDTITVWTDSMIFVGQSDELFREAERAEELDIDPERAVSARRRAIPLNDLAIDALDHRMPSAIDGLRRELEALPSYDLSAPLRTFEDTVRENLVELDLNRNQTGTAARSVRQAMDVARDSGVPGLCDFISERTRELSELRHRRAEHNDVAGAIFCAALAAIAAIIFAVCTANQGGTPCTDTTANIFAGVLLALAVAGAFAMFSEIGGVFFE
jgi:hypothetical protein